VSPNCSRYFSSNPAKGESIANASGQPVGAPAMTRVRNRGKMTIGKQLKIYSQLSKARLSALVVMTTSAGFFMAGAPVGWTALAATCVGTTMAACSANTFNQVYEVKTDSLMNRTRGRPLPMGKISRAHATGWGVATGVASAGLLTLGANPLTAGLGILNIGLYAGIYTPMKLRSEWNTWVGAIVGAIPPVMGYAAVTGTIASPECALLASTLFLWQFPHFFSLAWIHKKDYANGGYKMVPVADPTGARTARLVERYAAYMIPLPIISSAMGVTSYMFAVESLVVNGYAYMLARKFAENPDKESARAVFKASLWYLPVMLSLMVFHSKNWKNDEPETPAIITSAKQTLKTACPHEAIYGAEQQQPETIEAGVAGAERSSSSAAFCPIPGKIKYEEK
jgi:heme o synthase